MNPAVEGYAAAVLGDAPPQDRPGLAQDLGAVARLVADNRQLHAALTDTSLAGAARAAVLRDLLTGKVRPAAVRATAYTAAAVPAQEVPVTLAWLAQRAQQVAEGRRPEVVPLGHTEARQRVGGFAAALYEDRPAASLSEIEDELFRFARIVDATPELRQLLTDRDAAVDVRAGVVRELLEGKVEAETLRLVDYVVTAGRTRDFVGTLDWLVEETARARGWRVARVRAGQPVDDAERRQLQETLARLTGAPVELQVAVDPELLAGVRVQVGDLQIDATARGRLERLREHLATGAWVDGQPHGAQGAAHPPPAQPPPDQT